MGRRPEGLLSSQVLAVFLDPPDLVHVTLFCTVSDPTPLRLDPTIGHLAPEADHRPDPLGDGVHHVEVGEVAVRRDEGAHTSPPGRPGSGASRWRAGRNAGVRTSAV